MSVVLVVITFSALALLVGWQQGHPACIKLSGGVLVWSDMQNCIWPSWCHCYSLSLASVKSKLVLPFWYRLTQVVPDKRPLNGCVCVVSCYLLLLLWLNNFSWDWIAFISAFSALTLLVGRQEGHPACKKQSGGVLVWLSVWSNVHMAQLMPLPLTVSCFSKIQIAFSFLVPAHPGSPVQRAVKRVCVCVCE